MRRFSSKFPILLSYLFLWLSTSFVSARAQSGEQFRQWARETFDRIEQDFRVPGSSIYFDNRDRNSFATAWPLGVQLHALIAAGRINEAQSLADEIHARFWCWTNNRWGYNATADNCGDRYYDDNAWIAKALMELYRANQNANNLNRAREIVAFSMSGENFGSSPGGGIRWHEGDPDGQCLCATAPTMAASLMIYEVTGISYYLSDAQRLYSWVKSDRFGWGPGYRGYENAVIAQSALLLYRMTGDAVYLNDARHMGYVMEAAYIDWNNHALKETGQWGGHDMTNAYVELYEVDKDINWLNIAAGYLSFLHDRVRDWEGRYPEFWDRPGVPGKPDLLSQASAARAYAKIGTTNGAGPKYPEPAAVFQDCDYQGWGSVGLPIGRYTLADMQFRGINNDDISSLKVQPGYRITFYEDDNFQGAKLERTGDQNCLDRDGWDNRISSIVVEPITPAVTVYRDCNFEGRGTHLPAGTYTLADLQARGISNDDISSLQVAEGYEVKAYGDDFFSGPEIKLSSGSSCLINEGWNDMISSIQIAPLH